MFTRGCAFSGPRLAEPLGVMKRGGFSRRGAWPDAVNPLDVASDKIVQRALNMARMAPSLRSGLRYSCSCEDLLLVWGLVFFYGA